LLNGSDARGRGLSPDSHGATAAPQNGFYNRCCSQPDVPRTSRAHSSLIEPHIRNKKIIAKSLFLSTSCPHKLSTRNPRIAGFSRSKCVFGQGPDGTEFWICLYCKRNKPMFGLSIYWISFLRLNVPRGGGRVRSSCSSRRRPTMGAVVGAAATSIVERHRPRPSRTTRVRVRTWAQLDRREYASRHDHGEGRTVPRQVPQVQAQREGQPGGGRPRDEGEVPLRGGDPAGKDGVTARGG
jgi:hypothetical protein